MWRVIKSVLAAFFGVQKEARRREDFGRGDGRAFIVAGIVMGVVLVVLVALIAHLAAG
ncbi:DUF2970 domain-containing protein [Halomonas cerina]|uniref:DUF2970 domain-containing protein n=1 Tax=Halomonas cerina TaxID=447424 RepID=A0A839VGW0_9GAMM|nr:DUF2970 domain-containing protein [Halomonas cerina]MBB3191854.1 hypothetical protein [Halomonas cerina]